MDGGEYDLRAYTRKCRVVVGEMRRDERRCAQNEHNTEILFFQTDLHPSLLTDVLPSTGNLTNSRMQHMPNTTEKISKELSR